MVATRRSSSRLSKKPKVESPSSDEMEIDTPASSSSLSNPLHAQSIELKEEEEEVDDDDFQKPLPMPAARSLRSSRNKGKGKAKLEDASTPPSRPKLERDASFIRGRIAKIRIEQTGYRKSSGSNTASTSTSNSIVSSSSNATSPASLDDTEYELDGSVMADSAVPSPKWPSALTEFDSGSQQVSDNETETQDHDEAALDLALSNILASRRNPNLASGDTDPEEYDDDDDDELDDEANLSSSSSEAESTSNDESEDDLPLANRNNNRRRRVVPRRRVARDPHVSWVHALVHENSRSTRSFSFGVCFVVQENAGQGLDSASRIRGYLGKPRKDRAC